MYVLRHTYVPFFQTFLNIYNFTPEGFEINRYESHRLTLYLERQGLKGRTVKKDERRIIPVSGGRKSKKHKKGIKEEEDRCD